MPIAKNAIAYTVDGISKTTLEGALNARRFSPCLPGDMASAGFVAPLPSAPDLLVHTAGDIHAFAYRIDQKILPACVINSEVKERIEQIEEQQGRKVGRKEREDIKSAVTQELLAVAFIKTSTIHGWLDQTGEQSLLVVDTSSHSKAEIIMSAISGAADKNGEPIQFRMFSQGISVEDHLSAWVATEEPPSGFTMDDSAVFVGQNGDKVRASHISVTSPEVRELSVGRAVTELAMTHDDKISFIVGNGLAMKRIRLIGIDKDNPLQQDLLPDEKLDAELTVSAGLIRNAALALKNAMVV